MGSESAARLGQAQDEHAKRRAFIIVDQNMKHFKNVLATYLMTTQSSIPWDPDTRVWAESALETVNNVDTKGNK